MGRPVVPSGSLVRGRTSLQPAPSSLTAPGSAAQQLGAPVTTEEIRAGIEKAKYADEARDAAEVLQRRLQDQRLLQDLAENRFEGPRYRAFEEVLVRYAVSVMRGWLHSGHVFRLAKLRGYDLHPSEPELTSLATVSDARDELAMMTVAVALPGFRVNALIKGGWKANLGASLTTYFMGACVFVFPNEFRKIRVQRSRWNKSDQALARDRDEHVANYERAEWRSTEPASAVTGFAELESHLASVSPREAALVLGSLAGYTQAEMVEMFGEPSARAIEGALYRWRQNCQRDMKQKGGGI